MSLMGQDKAQQIAETLLERTAGALMSGDFDSLAACFYLPHVIETPDHKTVLKTRAALRDVFERVREDYRARQITDLVRFCEMAEFRGPNRIEMMHVTHMMCGSHRVVDPFPTYSVLERIGDTWLITTSQYAVDKDTTVGRALHLGQPAQLQTETHAPAGAPKKREN